MAVDFTGAARHLGTQPELVIEAAEGRHELGAGDFLIFSSGKPYVFANGGGGTVRYVRNVVL